MNNGPMIRVRDLTKTYQAGDQPVPVLRGVNLDVQPGEFVALVGHSGSGKTTFFNILGGLTPPTSGTVEIAGQNLAQLTDSGRTALRRRTVGFVFQKYNLLPTLTAADNIQIARYLAGNKHAGAEEAFFGELLTLLGIGHRLDHKPNALSGGEQQRVAIARALVNRPALLLADEPTGNLDTENSEKVLALLRDLNQRLKQTIVMITHNPEAAAYGSRLVRMKDGRVLEE